MRKIAISSILFMLTLFSIHAQDIAPYIKVGTTSEGIENAVNKVTQALENNSFTILGSYTPANNNELRVVTFTNNELKNTVIKVTDRGALAAVFKVGFNEKNGVTTISYSNPDYILRAYLNNNYNSFKSVFTKFSSDVKKALSSVGTEFTPFGGSIKADKLGKYHYKIMMPYFTDPVELREFASFEEGVKTIQQNLKNMKGGTKEVYSLVYSNEKVAVFGVGLLNNEDGEPNFLPKIGDEHVAALPYEIILQGNTATMLHGKYRIALHWPDLTMGTFMKIMSTPGDIEDALEAICN